MTASTAVIVGDEVHASAATHSQRASSADFAHIRNGNYQSIQEAIETFLRSKGIAPQSQTAELIMFMERSFCGKYRRGERFHYQQVMPSPSWRKGDSLSEKLTRCKDKETFKRRFDRIGTTEILRLEHFDNREIGNLDFKGKMYLRLIDTHRNNLSRFYRNDVLVDAFFCKLQAFVTERKRIASLKTRGKTVGTSELADSGNPEEIKLEIPKSLPSTVSTGRQSEKHSFPSLTLAYSSPSGKKQNPPAGEEMKIEIGYKPDDNHRFAESCGLIESTQLPESKRTTSQRQSAKRKGEGVYEQWRSAILTANDQLCITRQPSGKLVQQASILEERFAEFFPDTKLVDFLRFTAKNWMNARGQLKEAGVWQNLGFYPELQNLVLHSDKIFSWFKRELASEQWKACQGRMPLESAKRVNTGAFLHGKNVTSEGHTFRSQTEPESLEKQIAYCKRNPEGLGISEMLGICQELLKNHSINLGASEARIDELSQMSEDELNDLNC